MAQALLNKLKSIGVFCHVVDSGSMRKAAAKLGITPPAVSQFINQLEADLNVTLLYRSTRSISTSEAGEKFYQLGKKMLSAAELAEDVINQSKSSISGELRIALPVGLAAGPIAKALFSVFSQHPELRLSVIACDTQVDFVQERIDLLLDCGEARDSNFIYHYLGKGHKVICASPDYLVREGSPVEPEELTTHCWLGLGQVEAKGILSEVELTHNKLESFSYKPKPRFKFNDLNSLISHVKQGFGIALLPALEVKELLETGELIALLPNWQSHEHPIYALTPDKKYPAKVKVALDALKVFFAEETG